MQAFYKEKIAPFLGKLLIYLIVIYTFFLLGKAVWTNYELKKQAEQIENQMSEIKKYNKNLQNLIVYYQSESFREIQARSKLGLIKPGEKVEQVPVKKFEDFQSEQDAQIQNITENKDKTLESNIKLWWDYFTK